jgi:hypothetical protein
MAHGTPPESESEKKIIGTVKEDRGPIGIKGRRLYSIAFTPEAPPEFMIELTAEELELVSDNGSPN